MSKRKAKKQPIPVSARDALEMADSMGMGEQAAMHVAAEMCGMEYEDFIEALAEESSHG